MSSTLIISDNEILNQLYVTNLEVYLGTQSTLTTSVEEAAGLLKQNSFDMIICMSMLNGHDSAGELNKLLTGMDLNIPKIIIGKPVSEIPDAIVVTSSFQLQSLIQAGAKILKVTAKEMAAKEMPQYYSVETRFLLRLRQVPCTIYLQTRNKEKDAEEYIMIARKGHEGDVIKKFDREGIARLHVNSMDRLTIVNSVSEIICDQIKNTEGLDVKAKSEAMSAGFEFAAATFSQSPVVVSEIMNIANACTKVMEEVVKDTPSLKGLLNLLNSNKEGYIYSHAMLAAYVSNHIIKNVTWGGEKQIEKINFVLFFHDIMLAPIYLKHPQLKYEEDLLFSEELTDKEKEVVLNHARLAAELIVTHKRAPIGSDLLIKQHHGMTNGIGFALEFKDDISPLSKIVLVAEAFVEEFLKERDQNPLYQLDVKQVQAALVEKFKKSTYKKIIETLDTMVV